MAPLLPLSLALQALAAPAPQGAIGLQDRAVVESSLSFTQRTVQLAGTPKAIVAAPLDADSLPDLALVTWEPPTSSSRTHLSTFQGQVGGKLVPAWKAELGEVGVSHALRAFDVNGDGWLDLSVPGMVGVGALRPGDGTLVYDDAVHVPNVGGLVHELTYADFTGDGLLDSMTAVNDIGGYFLDTGVNVGGLSFATWSSASIPAVAYDHAHMICVDLEGDGVASNVVFSSNFGLTTLEFGVWPEPIAVFPGVFGEVAAVDLDADGDLDLVATMPVRGLARVFENDGSGALAASVSVETGLLPSHVAIADVDLDGHADALVTNEGSGTIALLAGDGNGRLSLALAIPVGGSPTDLEVVDLDLDGDLDLIVIDESARTLSILRNQLVP